MIYRNFLYFSYGSIGDFLMTLFLMEEMRKSFPGIKCTVFATKNVRMLAELAAAYPGVAVVPLGLKHPAAATKFFFREFLYCNIAAVPPSFGTNPWYVKLIARLFTLGGGSRAVGYPDASSMNRQFFDTLVPFDTEMLFLGNLKKIPVALGASLSTGLHRFAYRAAPQVMSRYGLIGASYIVLHPFAANPIRSLPLGRWRALLAYLRSAHPGCRVILTGAANEKHVADAIVKGFADTVNAAGDLSMGELATLIDGAALFIGPDSGVTHLASALGKKSVVIGNRSNPTWLPYYNPSAIVLFEANRCTCAGDKSGDCFETIEEKRYYRCMVDITDERIYKAVASSLAGTPQ